MGSYAGVDWAAEKHDVFVAVEFPRFARHLGLAVNSKYIMSFELVSLNYPA